MSPSRPLFPPPRSWTSAPGTCDTSGVRGWEDLRARARTDSSRPPEEFRLTLSEDRLHLDIGSDPALRYAWDTLRQLQGDDPLHTPCGILEDAPVLARRAFLLDISRCKIPTQEGFRRWLDLLAGFRYNELQLYIEHTFAYAGHETVWRDASPLTAADVAWLGREAKDRGIRLVPHQNCFGHFERWIRHPPYRRYAESPDGFVTPWGETRTVGSVLKPDDASFELVTGLLDELLPLFDSPRVGIGCDETFELGRGASRKACERDGVGAVYADFVGRIMRHVQGRHGRQPEFWCDIIQHHPAELDRLPPGAAGLVWGYEADHPFAEECAKAADHGLPFTVCPGTSSWRSFAGRSDNMTLNIQSAVAAGIDRGAEGLLLTDWGDCGHLQQEPVSYPALAWAALLGWCGTEASPETAASWCDRVAFGGPPGETRRWLDAGRVSEATGVAPVNATLLFNWFLNPGHKCGLDVPDHAMCEVEARLDALLPPSGFREEWDQTLRNLRASLALQRDFRRGTCTARDLLGEAAEAHALLWRRQNREGGLAESLEAYTNARDPNPGKPI